VRVSKNETKIEKDGYLGSVIKQGNLFKPTTKKDGKKIYLSSGGFKTKEEAEEVLKEYSKDPENFKKISNRNIRETGQLCLIGKRWRLTYKHKHLGYYDTKEEAEEALQSSIYTSSSEIA